MENRAPAAGMEGASRQTGRLGVLLVMALALHLSGCKDAVQIANVPKSVVGVEKDAVQIKAVDLGQLKELQSKIEAQARDITWLKGQMNIRTGNIITGGTTHIVILILGLSIIGILGYVASLHVAHSRNLKAIRGVRMAVDDLVIYARDFGKGHT